MYTIFTDGSCLGNPGPGGYAAIVRNEKEEETVHTGADPSTTNNRMELLAAVVGLEHVPSGSKITLITDSNYLVKGMTEWMDGWKRRGWKNSQKKPVSNRDLWERLDDLASERKVRWQWVEAHAGHPENERCDQLARDAATQVQSL